MGLIGFLRTLFGRDRNVIAETAEVFRENAEASAQRSADYRAAALSQLAAEFQLERRGFFDRFMDGLNRLPRPLMVLSVFGLFAAAMLDPIWFASRMQGLALVPDPLWYASGMIVAFYFGGRFQIKSQEFKQSIGASVTALPQVLDNIQRIRSHMTPGEALADEATMQHDLAGDANPAVAAWKLEGVAG